MIVSVCSEWHQSGRIHEYERTALKMLERVILKNDEARYITGRRQTTSPLPKSIKP